VCRLDKGTQERDHETLHMIEPSLRTSTRPTSDQFPHVKHHYLTELISNLWTDIILSIRNGLVNPCLKTRSRQVWCKNYRNSAKGNCQPSHPKISEIPQPLYEEISNQSEIGKRWTCAGRISHTKGHSTSDLGHATGFRRQNLSVRALRTIYIL